MIEQPITEVKQEEKPRIKTLANCSPRDFLVQTNRIRKKAAEWLTLTQISEIRKKAPVFTDEMTDEEKREAARKQAKENIFAMLDCIMEEHPDETVELLGMMCFLPPEEVNNHTMLELMKPFMELVGNPEVVDFFISLTRLAQIDTSMLASA